MSSHSRSASATTVRQPVTPELRAWIIEQAEAGFTGPVVLQSMLDAGWDEAVAVHAMETALADEMRKKTQLPPATATAPSTAQRPHPIPEPDLSQSPARIDVGDREVEVLMSLHEPRVVLFGNLLSPEECDALIAAAEPRMARSLTVATRTGGEEVNDDRTSDGMFFQRGENDVVARLEARIAQLVRWPVENGEGLQVLHYRPGAEYKPHYDYFDPEEPGTPTILRRGGQRVATLVIYLNDPEQGGGTTFPDVQLEVAPRRGNAVFFSYDRPHPATRSLHGGAPVIRGEKWIATKWLREREFH
jgi:prolyl 4-hydroxylase